MEEGGWQGRIVCETLGSDDLAMVCQFANVEKAVVNEELSKKEGTVVDVYFKNARTIYRDMPLIAAQLGLNEDSIQYNSLLLSRYFIHDPEDEAPPMLLALYYVNSADKKTKICICLYWEWTIRLLLLFKFAIIMPCIKYVYSFEICLYI